MLSKVEQMECLKNLIKAEEMAHLAEMRAAFDMDEDPIFLDRAADRSMRRIMQLKKTLHDLEFT